MAAPMKLTKSDLGGIKYCPKTGNIYSKRGVVKARNGKGYVVFKTGGRMIKAHRAALVLSGVDLKATDLCDHINGVRDDNRLENLRVVTHGGNCGNKAMHRSGKLLGAVWEKSRSKWRSVITIGGKSVFLGRFDTEAEAHSAFVKADIL